MKNKKLNRVLSLILVVLMLNLLFPLPSHSYAASKTVNLKGTYHAAMGLQTCDKLWCQRMAYYNKTINDKYGTKDVNKIFSGSTKTSNYVTYKGTFTDVKIAGNGTYTLSLKGADFRGETSLSQLHIATDIPVNNKIKFTNVKVKVNGKTKITLAKGYGETDKKFLAGGMVILAINHWRAPLEKTLKDKGLSFSSNGGVQCLSGNGKNSIQITFTVSGFSYKKGTSPK